MNKINSVDKPIWSKAMHGSDLDGFDSACQDELFTLSEMNTW